MAHELAGQPTLPRYTEAELDSIRSTDLHARLERIDNPIALGIAQRLLQMTNIDHAGQPEEPVDDHAKRRLPARRLAGRALPQRRLRQLAGRNPQALLAMIEAFRRLDFSELLAGGPQGISARLDERPVLLRVLGPRIRVEGTQDIAELVAKYAEFLADPEGQLRWTAYVPFAPLLPALLCMAVLFPLTMLKPVPWLLPIGLLLPLFIASGLFFSWFTNRERQRMLALYISFTDEFVADVDEGCGMGDEEESRKASEGE